MDDWKIQGPIDVELKVHVTDGKRAGVATIGMGRGVYVDEATLRARVAKFEKEEMPDGFRLMSKREFFDQMIPPAREFDEETGEVHVQRFAMPGGDDFDA